MNDLDYNSKESLLQHGICVEGNSARRVDPEGDATLNAAVVKRMFERIKELLK